jgi:hypothetical protein
MDIKAVNRDSRIYGTEAAAFDPFRKLPADQQWGMTFGDGSHNCIGRSMVTGIPTADGGRSNGVIAAVLQVLFEHGIRPDPELSPMRRQDDHFDFYDSYPVELRIDGLASRP